MKKIKLYVLIMITLTVVRVYAKRSEPPKVKPLIHNGLIIKVDPEKMGFILVYDTNKTLLWTKRIYKVIYNPFLEKDVQDVFIKKLMMKKGVLIIINEDKKYFSLDLDKKKVKNLNQKEIDSITSASEKHND